MNSPRPPELPDSAKVVWQGKIFTAWHWEQQLYDGTTKTFEALTRPDYVSVIGVLPDNQILLVEDEQPHRDKVLTSAGGRMEVGEEPAIAAKREFLEETGYSIGKLKPWYRYRPESKIIFYDHFFIGQDLQKQHEPEASPGERISLRTFSFDEFLQLGQSGELRDLFLRTQLLEALLDSMKRDKLHQLLFT